MDVLSNKWERKESKKRREHTVQYNIYSEKGETVRLNGERETKSWRKKERERERERERGKSCGIGWRVF